MQLFSRQVMMSGPADQVFGWATEIRAMASEKMSSEISVWAAAFGAPIGALAFTMLVEGVADLTAKAAPLEGDADYAALLAKGAELMTGPPTDMLGTPLNGEFGDTAPVGSYATVTDAVIANGQFAEAVGWSVDIAEHVTNVTSTPLMVLMQEFGTFGQLTFIGVNTDAAALDAGSAKLSGDEGYVKKLSAAGDLFVPGSAHRSLLMRVA